MKKPHNPFKYKQSFYYFEIGFEKIGVVGGLKDLLLICFFYLAFVTNIINCFYSD